MQTCEMLLTLSERLHRGIWRTANRQQSLLLPNSLYFSRKVFVTNLGGGKSEKNDFLISSDFSDVFSVHIYVCFIVSSIPLASPQLCQCKALRSHLDQVIQDFPLL